jgi:hypothetical protein
MSHDDLSDFKDHVISAAVFAITSPGGTKIPVASAYQKVPMGLSTSHWPDATVERSQMPWTRVQYIEVAINTASGPFATTMPPCEDGSLTEAMAALQLLVRPRLSARFLPQVWQGDEAVPGGDEVEFNCIEAFSRMSLPAALDALKPGLTRDALADGLTERADHNGPFEVVVDEAALVHMVCLVADHMHFPTMALGDLSHVPRLTWDKFRMRVRKVLDMAQTEHAPVGAAPVDLPEAPDEDLGQENAAATTEAEDLGLLEREAGLLGLDALSPAQAQAHYEVPEDPAQAFADGWNARHKVDGALDRLIKAFGDGYPASVRADMNMVVAEMAEMARLRAKSDRLPKPVAVPKKARTQPRERPRSEPRTASPKSPRPGA